MQSVVSSQYSWLQALGTIGCKSSVQSVVSSRCSWLQALGAVGCKPLVQSVASPQRSQMQAFGAVGCVNGVGCKLSLQASIVNSLISVLGCWAVRESFLVSVPGC